MNPRNILEISAKNNGDRIALIAGNEKLNFSELNILVNALAASLRHNRVSPGSQIAIIEHNSIAFVIWLLAIFKAGGIAATIDPNQKKSALCQLLATGEIDYVACQNLDMHLDGVEWVHQPVGKNEFYLKLWRRKTLLEKEYSTKPNHILQRFSSGSTGTAKHILFDEDQLADDYSHLIRKLDLNNQDRFLGVTPFFHSFGCLSLLSAITVGATTVVSSKFIPSRIINLCLQYDITVYFATPAMLDLLSRCHLPESNAQALGHIRYLISATGVLNPAVRTKFYERFRIPIQVLYGSTETGSVSIDLENFSGSGCVGKPLPGVSIKIVDDNLSEVDRNKCGKVAVKSPSCCHEYTFSDHHLNSLEGFIFPGDKGYIDEEGRLFILGRDDIINVGGYKVDRAEIGKVILKHFPASDVAIRLFDRMGQPAIEAFVEGIEAELDTREIIDTCSEHLAPYKVPAKVTIIKNLPRDSNGKVRVTEL